MSSYLLHSGPNELMSTATDHQKPAILGLGRLAALQFLCVAIVTILYLDNFPLTG